MPRRSRLALIGVVGAFAALNVRSALLWLDAGYAWAAVGTIITLGVAATVAVRAVRVAQERPWGRSINTGLGWAVVGMIGFAVFLAALFAVFRPVD